MACRIRQREFFPFQPRYNIDKFRGCLSAYPIYGTTEIAERHRHRWEFNNKYLKQFEDAGMIASGINPESGLVEILELSSHPFFIGVQYHPELKSTVENPHPLFIHFIKAAKEFTKVNQDRSPISKIEV